jgi:hypothetical protein
MDDPSLSQLEILAWNLTKKYDGLLDQPGAYEALISLLASGGS